ncbi:MAG TPA: rhodanese-like domain-containing protein [Flavobacteriaceae bacterium]|nr:rhodanese-like domain-containing protein [Flavobacteriaceae bacterium]
MADLIQEEWSEQLSVDDNAVVLDVRTEDEYEDGYIPNAINIDIYEGQGFISKLEELDKSKTYFVYCRSGNRSAQACAIMNQLGFEKAHNLLGGIIEWEGEIN